MKRLDWLLLGALGVFSLMGLLFNHRVPQWENLILINLLVSAVYLVLIALHGRLNRKWPRFILRSAAVQLMFAHIFWSVHPLQLVFHSSWQDTLVTALEYSLLGFHPTLRLQSIVSWPLTEWLMFAYVIYIPLFPVLGAIITHRAGERGLEHYLFALGVTTVSCALGFILFPVASPMYYFGHRYTVPLSGGPFTWMGEFIRTHMHPMGGSIPSPHTAIATIMWLMAYRYHKPTMLALTPVILSLYAATFYGRYHYVTDTVTGILLALLIYSTIAVLRRRESRAPIAPVGQEI